MNDQLSGKTLLSARRANSRHPEAVVDQSTSAISRSITARGPRLAFSRKPAASHAANAAPADARGHAAEGPHDDARELLARPRAVLGYDGYQGWSASDHRQRRAPCREPNAANRAQRCCAARPWPSTTPSGSPRGAHAATASRLTVLGRRGPASSGRRRRTNAGTCHAATSGATGGGAGARTAGRDRSARSGWSAHAASGSGVHDQRAGPTTMSSSTCCTMCGQRARVGGVVERRGQRRRPRVASAARRGRLAAQPACRDGHAAPTVRERGSDHQRPRPDGQSHEQHVAALEQDQQPG